MGLAKFKEEFHYAENHDADSTSIVPSPNCSLFELEPPMPGVMTKEEVERDIDLGSWKIDFDGETYTLDVSTVFQRTKDDAHSSTALLTESSVSAVGTSLTFPIRLARKVGLPNLPLALGRSW